MFYEEKHIPEYLPNFSTVDPSKIPTFSIECSTLKQDNMSVPTYLTENTTLVEFHLFPDLPLELRLKIWAATIRPRIIEVIYIDHMRLLHGRHAFPDPHCIPKYTSTAPPLLHVNSESRAEGLRHYEISNPDDLAINRFYFNPSMDVIDIRRASGLQWQHFFRQNRCGLVNTIQKLAMPKGAFMHSGIDITPNLPSYCPALREVTIVALKTGETCISPTLLGPEGANTCSCQIKTLLDYEELTEAGKLETMDVWWAYAHTENRELLGWEAFASEWKMATTLPCPSIGCVAICRRSKRWRFLPKVEVNRFVAARALEELSQLMRWLFPET